MISRHGRDAQVDGLPFDPYLDATILRQAFLGDAHRAGHDLEPADNRRLQTLRWRLHFLQHAVNPKSDAKFFVQRFEMNIARASAVRLDQQHGYEPDNRRICFIDCGSFCAIAKFQTQIDVFPNFFLEDVRRFVGRAVVFD